MGMLDRMSRLIRANVNDMIDRAEDPEKMIDQILRDMESNIRTARSQVAAMIAQEKELEADLNETRQLADEWNSKASRAVQAGKDDLAREALRRKRDNEENAKVYATQFQTQQQTVEKLKAQLQQLESKYQQTLSQRDSLIARQRRAEATKKVTAGLDTATLSPLDASSELDRMERKIRSTESEALAAGEMASSSFDSQFRDLDYDVDIESQLEALKSGSSSGDKILSSNTESTTPMSAGTGEPASLSDDDIEDGVFTEESKS